MAATSPPASRSRAGAGLWGISSNRYSRTPVTDDGVTETPRHREIDSWCLFCCTSLSYVGAGFSRLGGSAPPGGVWRLAARLHTGHRHLQACTFSALKNVRANIPPARKVGLTSEVPIRVAVWEYGGLLQE